MSLIKLIGLVSFCFLLCLGCTQSKKQPSNLLAFIPNNSQIIIKINSLEGLASGLKNNSLISAVENFTSVKKLKSQIPPFWNISEDKILITLSTGSEDRLDISFIIPLTEDNQPLDSIKGLNIEPFYENTLVNTIAYKDDTFYSTLHNNVLFISNNLDLTVNATPNKQVNSEISNLFKVSSHDRMVSVLVHHSTSFSKPLILSDSTFNAQKFSKYTLLDVEISQNAILANGIAVANDSSASFINLFKNTVPQENKLPRVLPATIKKFASITFDNYNIFRTNLAASKHIEPNSNTSINFQNITEIGQAQTDTQHAVIVRSIDLATTLNKIEHSALEDTYRGKTIYTLKTAPSFLIECSTILNSKSWDYFITLEECIIFSNDIEFLKSIIANHQNKTTLENSSYYSAIKLELSNASSLLIYGNNKSLNDLINLNFDEDLNLDISSYKASALQYVYDHNFAHIAAVLKPNKTKTNRNSVSEEFSTSLDAKLLTPPQFVKNHKNNQMDIIVQDIDNNLYLISNKGNVFWKKQLDGKLLGPIHQIDTYKNGRLQFVFNTSNRVYVIDRTGRDVNLFPLKFNNNITHPVSVFDYDKNKNYRILVTQGKALLMYDKNGKRVTGFKYKPTHEHIASQPKHFRIGSKDCIVFKNGNTIKILDRKGLERAKVKETLNFSENDLYFYKDNFTTLNTNGALLQVNAKGQVTRNNLNLSNTHKIATTSKTLVALNENILTIKSKTIELEFGEYTTPKIFYINNKIYVTVTDLQSKKAYLFDSQAKPISNFPVYANSEIDLNNIDKDDALELITKGDDRAIIVYEIH